MSFKLASALMVPLLLASVVAAADCPTTPPLLQEPPSDAKVLLPVKFDWSDVPGAVGYKLFIQKEYQPADLLAFVANSQFVAGALPQGTFKWSVVAVVENCPVLQASPFTLTVLPPSTSCPQQSATLVSPADGATNVSSPVTLDWTDVAGALEYRVYIGLDGAPANPVAVVTDSQFVAPLPSGAIEWYVESFFPPGCPSTTSAHFKFTSAAAVCPDNPTPPAVIAPADGATNVSSPVTFKWTAVAGAREYHVWLNRGDSPPQMLGVTFTTEYTAALPSGTFSWQVMAIFGDQCPTGASKPATFTIAAGAQCPTTAPTLTAPPNGATNVSVPIDFQWSAVTGAVGYRLLVAVNAGSFDVFGETPETTARRIVPTGTITWKVTAKFPGCPDQTSSTSTFTVTPSTECAPQTITLSSPPNGTTQKSPVTFTWSAVNGATNYRLWVGINGGPPDVAMKTSATTASVPLPSGAIEWYVEALLTNCPSLLSAHGTFTVEKNQTCATEPPALLSPVGSQAEPASTSTSVTFQWKATAGAALYVLWLAPAGQPFADVFATKETSHTRDLGSGTYSWFVEALFEGCENVRSSPAFFKADSSIPRCSSDAPVLILPADGDAKVSTPVKFLWSSVTGADEYRLFSKVEGSSEPAGMIAVTRETSITLPLPPGTITWAIEAVFRGCPSTRSAPSKLTVPRSGNCPTEGPAATQLLSPADGSTVGKIGPVEFSWTAVSGAAAYVLVVRTGEGAPTPLAETTDTHVERPIPEGKVEWWVVTFVAGCGASDSKHFTFTLPESNCPPLRPILLAPPDNTQLLSPAAFEWTPVPNAKEYKVWTAAEGGASLLAKTTTTEALVTVSSGMVEWFVEAIVEGCPSPRSPIGRFKVLSSPPACHTPEKPDVMAPGQVVTGSPYKVRWTVIPNSDHYELQESKDSTFSAPATQVVTGISAAFTHTSSDKPVPYFYRVRAISSCPNTSERGAYSDVVTVFIVPVDPKSQQKHVTAEMGAAGNLTQEIFIPGSAASATYSAKADKSWLTVTPASGTIPPEGVTLKVTADPSALPLGTNTATLQVTSGASKRGMPYDVTAKNVPVSVSLVTPVAPVSKNTPPPESLIIPAVAHAAGVNDSMFESDVRVVNTAAEAMKYLLNFTPSGTDGTQSGSSSTIQVDAGTSMALDDVLASFFGVGAASGATGVLEIRPLPPTSTTSTSSYSTSSTAGTQLTSIASSRTYNVTSSGTFGQFIPAIPFSQFIAKSTTATPSVLSLQQIAQSASYRTNVGLVEAAGQAADVMLTVFDNTGTKLAEIPQSLRAGEHMQLNQFLANNKISLEDGRIEVTVVSDTGRVTAYASTLDNRTNDPLLVSPVLKGAVSSTRYVIPGVADLNTGIAQWRTDVRLFNAGATSVTATLTYTPQTGSAGASGSVTATIGAGEVKVIDNILQTLFSVTNSGGAVLVTTPEASNLVVTARTYNQTDTGTYGQFIPGITPNDSVGKGGRALQLLQLEHSSRMRTNVGMAETTGNAASVEVALVLSDSKVTQKTTFNLAANEFRQFSLGDFGVSNIYNARVTLKVTDGSGKVTAYGSVIDQVTQDPTYVPAQ